MRTSSKPLLLAALAATILGCDNDYRTRGGAPDRPDPGDTFGVTSANRIVTFNRANPSVRTSAAISGLQAGETLLGIDARPGGTPGGQLYALGSTGRLYTIDRVTGAATQRAILAADSTDATNPFTTLSGTNFGVDFNPVVDRLRVVSDTGQNLRINVDTGATITDGTLNVATVTRTGVVAAAYTNSFAAACRTALFYLDAAADRLFTTTDPNNGVLTDVGALGIDADAITSFEIVTAADASNTGLALITGGGSQTLQSINLSTGAITAAGTITGLNSGETVRMLASMPPSTAPAQPRGELTALTASNTLISITAAAPQKTCTSAAVTGLQANENLFGIDVRPADGNLYAVGSTGRIYTLDPATGAATMRSILAADSTDTTNPFTALAGTDFGVDFNPIPDRLRVVSNTGQNLRINVDSGATTTDTDLNPAGSAVTGAAYTNSFAGTGTTQLYVIDTTNDRLMLQGQPSGNPNNGDLQVVGALGGIGDVQAVTGLDIDGRNNSAFAALTIGTATTSELHSINLATGAATRVNAIGGGERIRGLTFSTRAVATVFGLTTDNRLVNFNVTTPGTLISNMPITGLQGGENIVGVDFRPNNGVLYAITDAGRQYVVPNIATAAASFPLSLTADPTDATAPFTMTMGTAYGVDFNPVPDRLRVVSNANENLRINPANGATITDATLNPPGSTIVAAAYTNSFAPSPDATRTTVLYVIDSTGNRLMIQGQPSGSPNNGDLQAVGALGITLDAAAHTGFDIVGGDNGLALAVLQPTGATQSTLYRVNLATGAVTAIGAVGPVGTPVLRGVAIRLQ